MVIHRPLKYKYVKKLQFEILRSEITFLWTCKPKFTAVVILFVIFTQRVGEKHLHYVLP